MNVASPSITIFSCAYCGAVPRELAAIRRITYPANVHVVEFPCLSRVYSDVVLGAFESGADGVILVGCEEGNCHHQGGNLRAIQRFPAMRSLLDTTGIGGERLVLWLTGLGQPFVFAEKVREFVDSIAAMGPSPLKSGGNIR